MSENDELCQLVRSMMIHEKNVNEVKFSPNFLPDSTETNKAINSIIEIRDIWKYVIKTQEITYKGIFERLSLPLEANVLSSLSESKEEFAIYDKENKKWLFKPENTPNLENYRYFHSGLQFEETKSYIYKEENGLMLFGSYTIVMQEPNLLKASEESTLKLNEFSLPEIDMIVGVPGCGKTTYILKNHKFGDLVLTTTSQGAQEIRKRIGLKENYRTIDSYLLNRRSKYREVWIDEALLCHPGQIFLVCLYSECEVLHLLGDFNQIPYINRVDSIELKYDDPKLFFKQKTFLNTSHRCPMDAIATIADRYEVEIFSSSDVFHSMNFKICQNVPEIKRKDVKYLVFTQKEKYALRNKGYHDVSTVHEHQGKQSDNVILVRLSASCNGRIYNSDPHILVALSRHKNTLTYITPVEDKLVQYIITAKAMELSNLRKFKVPSCKDELTFENNTFDEFIFDDHAFKDLTCDEFAFDDQIFEDHEFDEFSFDDRTFDNHEFGEFTFDDHDVLDNY